MRREVNASEVRLEPAFHIQHIDEDVESKRRVRHALRRQQSNHVGLVDLVAQKQSRKKMIRRNGLEWNSKCVYSSYSTHGNDLLTKSTCR